MQGERHNSCHNPATNWETAREFFGSGRCGFHANEQKEGVVFREHFSEDCHWRDIHKTEPEGNLDGFLARLHDSRQNEGTETRPDGGTD